MRKPFDTHDINLKALFLGDKGENADLMKTLLNKLIDEHVGWRQNYMPEDKPVITTKDKRESSYLETRDHLINVLDELSCTLRTKSCPWHSAGRFWGHMNSETLMPAILAYTFAMLWNGNNVAYESSPGTSEMEEEVGNQFAKLMGFPEGWGHIAADGSLANLEGLWYARNFKSMPLAIKDIMPELVAGMDDWRLLNLSVEEIIELLKKSGDKLDAIKQASARGGHHIDRIGNWIVPQTKHYSWLKAADIVGVGLDRIVECKVTNHFQMDVEELEKIIRGMAAEKTPILGVVAVVGSTEEGQIDRVDKIVELRERLKKEGIYFYIHVDAAYGGYGRSIFIDSDDTFIPYDHIPRVYRDHNIFQGENKWLDEGVYHSFRAISEAESVTIDPHKMGYIPYSAGGVVIKYKAMRDVISYFATYVFEKTAHIPALLGAYILEGSKAGATAAAVWTAHKVLPLNVTGYGKLIGASIEGAYRFYTFLDGKKFTVRGRTIVCHCLTKPNFNMVDYIFNEEGNTDLVKMNKLNHDFYDWASYAKGGLYDNDFITSHTDFATPDYGNSPFDFVKRLGFSWEGWQDTQKVTILRASCMSPYMYDEECFNEYAEKIEKAIQGKLESIYADYDLNA